MAEFFLKLILKVDRRKESNVPAALDILNENIRRSSSLSNLDELPEIPVHPEDRIQFLSKYYTWIPANENVLAKFSKNTEISCQLRNVGNENYAGSKFQEALEYCNLAIMFAKGDADGEDLALAYANRSAILVELDHPEEALDDIQLALEHNYPKRLMPKLEKRRVKCQKMLEDGPASHVKTEVDNDAEERKKYRDQFLLRLQNPNPLMPSAESFVKVEYTQTAGRQLVVDQDVPAGTVVIVEKPFVSVLDIAPSWQTKHCGYCLKYIRRGIPCTGCVFVLYCSENCRAKAEAEYHKHECNCMGYFYLNSYLCYQLLAFRVVCKVGPEELFRIFSTKDRDYFDRPEPFGTEPDCKYESDPYLPIYYLVNHSAQLPGRTRRDAAVTSLLNTSILQAQTTFFSGIPKESLPDFKNFVASLFLRHTETIMHNQIVLNEIKELNDISLKDFYSKRAASGALTTALRDKPDAGTCFDELGTGVFAVGSLINHSCDPNVYRVNDVKNGTLIVVTVRNLKKGEALSTMYGQAFFDAGTSLSDRRSYLERGYHFICQCVACRNDWLNRFGELDADFCCPTCSRKFLHDERGSGEFFQCRLGYPRWSCGICGRQYAEKSFESQLNKNMMKFTETYQMVITNQPLKAVAKFKESVEFFQFSVAPPYGPIYSNQYTFQQALALILRYAKED